MTERNIGTLAKCAKPVDCDALIAALAEIEDLKRVPRCEYKTHNEANEIICTLRDKLANAYQFVDKMLLMVFPPDRHMVLKLKKILEDAAAPNVFSHHIDGNKETSHTLASTTSSVAAISSAEDQVGKKDGKAVALICTCGHSMKDHEHFSGGFYPSFCFECGQKKCPRFKPKEGE